MNPRNEEKSMNPLHPPTPVILTCDDHIPLYDCYLFRDGLAYKADVSIATAVSYTSLPHLLNISVEVPGYKNLDLSIGIPFDQASCIDKLTQCWASTLHHYDALRSEIMTNVFTVPISDVTEAPWTSQEVRAVEQMVTIDDVGAMVKDDLLRIGTAALEKQDV